MYNLVENFVKFAQVKNISVEKLVINNLLTRNSQLVVDNGCTTSVGKTFIIFHKQLFLQTQILKKEYILRSSYSVSFTIMFFTLSTIRLVFIFSFTSFFILL